MACPRCGASLAPDAERCGACGTAFATATGVSTGAAAAGTPGHPNPTPAGFAATAPRTAGHATTSADGDTTHAGPGSESTTLASGATTFAAPAGRTAGTAASHGRNDGPLGVGQSFGPRYHIIRLLGLGGMGAVYQAWDAELRVDVALKVIRPELGRGGASSEIERRFKNELLLARQVTHKSVVRIHDLGEISGIKYITMPYIEGDDLATYLRKHGKIAVPLTLRLARQIASGLEAAHEAGVIHRDLKPANVMISGKEELHAFIMDFDISASTGDVDSGGVTGTFEYMAPEQATGTAVDGRVDIYAFGLILYEMLVGDRPSRRPTEDRLTAMKRRFEEGVPPIRTLDATVPDALAATVMQCLERDPAQRFASSADLVAALSGLDDNGCRSRSSHDSPGA